MIRPKQMSRVTVFGPKTFMKNVIDKFYEMNVIHIEDFSKKGDDEVFDIGEPFPQNEKYAEMLVKARTLASNLGIKNMDHKPSIAAIDAIDTMLTQVYDDATRLLSKRDYFRQIKKIYDGKLIEKCLTSLKIPVEKNADYADLVYFIGFADSSFDALKTEVEKITKAHFLYNVNFEGLNVYALLAEKGKKDKIEKILEEKDFSPIDVPIIKQNYTELELNAGQEFLKLNHQAEVSEKKLKELDEEIEKLKQEHSKFIVEAKMRLKMETDKAEAPLKFATTKNTFMIKGYIPTESTKKLETELNKVTTSKVMIKVEKVGKNDNVPVAFNHPKIVEPFEFFMDLYTLPSYKEIDPTFFMFLTFPLFFGFMLGDVGYGIITFVLFYILKKKMPGAKNFLNALLLSSGASIIFGFIYGEYFGLEEAPAAIGRLIGLRPEQIVLHGVTETVYNIPRLFSRSTNITTLLSLTIMFGIFHILIGLIVGFINVYKTHGLKDAVIEKVGWIFMLPIVMWLLVYFLKIITGPVADLLKNIIPPMPFAIGMAVLGVVLNLMGEGVMGIIELPGLVSNILSYARLMAVGLSSLELALVINNLAGQMFSSGPVGIISGILVLIIGHVINLALGILSPFLHALRLHYVEFFGKFYKGGGKKFKSFGFSE